MEKAIETAIDNGLESISSELYMFSVGIGIVLIMLAIVLFLVNRKSKGRKGITKSTTLTGNKNRCCSNKIVLLKIVSTYLNSGFEIKIKAAVFLFKN